MNFSLQKLSETFILNKLKLIKNGSLNLTNYNHEKFIFGEINKEVKADIKVNDPKFYFNILKGGSTGLAESYVRDDFSTSDLTSLIELTARNIDLTNTFLGILKISFLKNLFKNLFYSNTRFKSKENISKHYDLGNEFFSIWLDKTLTYSSAIFNAPNEDLANAQLNKYNKLIDLLKPKSGDKILEIGCGWGGFAEHLSKNYDIKLDCITISKKQLEFAKKRIFNAGLNHKVDIKFLDYRDLKGKYDSIASIEMIEAVGEKYLAKFFLTIKENLKPGGVGAIQAIIIKDELFERYRKREDFIQKYIFPGGFLPSLHSIKNYCKQTGLELTNYNSYGAHYSNTLKEWRNNFIRSWNDISKQGFDQSFKKIWDFYFSYCEAGFKSKNIDLIQFSLSNK
ncbi:MAG: cyclopropane-fatty-acyl-phospholipid synthase [Proteobacteria bacterium]|jgi:cyclopropane-fatty-acyl-phospholipid synthase|nr:cyclopropane-fatty-acyl-phospholipid synthase [Pseudomonadota bacterium]